MLLTKEGFILLATLPVPADGLEEMWAVEDLPISLVVRLLVKLLVRLLVRFLVSRLEDLVALLGPDVLAKSSGKED